MMVEKDIFTKEDEDYLNEMMNIGAGNAGAAMSQMFKCSVDAAAPAVHIYESFKEVVSPGDPMMPVSSVRMSMYGDVRGEILFLLYGLQQSKKAVQLFTWALQSQKKGLKSAGQGIDSDDLSVLSELGNIVGGVYLTAIHDFCRLNIYHTVPAVLFDTRLSIFDKTFKVLFDEPHPLIVIENRFLVEDEGITSYFMLISDRDSMDTLKGSIKEARKKMGMGQQGLVIGD